MAQLADVIQIKKTQTDAAIVVERSLDSLNLIESFAPTKASVKVLNHVCAAALPNATQEQRAINLFGNYGSGKSHLAVVLAQLLRDGSDCEAFSGLFERLSNFGETTLASDLKNTFLAKDDPDAKPYLLVSLYGSETPSLAAKLMEGLYEALERHPYLNHESILPKTEYDVAIQRFDEIVSKTPTLADTELSRELAIDYATTQEMRLYLQQHKYEALDVFKKWHQEVCHGALFNPANEGGKNFIEAYLEAGKNLAEQHHFGGIVVLWDEFGFALEDLLGTRQSTALQEIIALQKFVETVCKPASGHTIFIALSHVSFPEYAERMGSSEAVKGTLERIDGRFNRPFKIELSVSESEGYHLLGMQRTWTDQGQQLLAAAHERKEQLAQLCGKLPLFSKLGTQVSEVLNEIYPLHPMTAAGLFALSAFAQANRTALTFFRDNAKRFLDRPLSNEGLFWQEQIRLPELVSYYIDKIKEKKAADWERYERARGKIPADWMPEQRQQKQDLLAVCLLADLLGENFQATETFLSLALYDRETDETLIQDLLWLKEAGLLWKDELTQQWRLSGDTGVDIEALIAEQLPSFHDDNLQKLFKQHPIMQEDLLPQIGEHELEPSACGIVRSYSVDLLRLPFVGRKLNPLLSGQVYLVLANNAEDVVQIKNKIQEMTTDTVYFWLPLCGISAESVNIEGTLYKLGTLLCRYLALEFLLKQKTNSDELCRQLTAKGEKVRQEALNILCTLFGRDGLKAGKSQIFKAGSLEPIPCGSWYELRHELAKSIQNMYPQEVPIRANNMNKLSDESYTGRQIVLDIVQRILSFTDNEAFKNDLLGHKETSEPAAIIDGVLGANNLFIQRATGWDIKKIDETTGHTHTLLKHIHDTLLRKRESEYEVRKLREGLIKPPYGIPACNLAILTAVAMRSDVKKLRWVGSNKETEFAKNLSNAFNENSELKLRLLSFNPKQLVILGAISDYFGMEKTAEQSGDEFAADCAFKLRDFVKVQPDELKKSRSLQEKTQELVKFFNNPFKTQQEIADYVIELLGIERESLTETSNKINSLLKILLDDFAEVADARRYELEQSWQDFCVSIPEHTDLLQSLGHDSANEQAKAVAKLLSDKSETNANLISATLLNKSFEQCDDKDIGKCQGILESLVNYHPPTSPLTVHEPKFSVISTREELELVLRIQLEKSEVSNTERRAVLQALLNHYQDN